MDIKESIEAAGIHCNYAACCSITEYVCYNTTCDAVNAVLKSIGVYDDYRAVRPDNYQSKAVYVNRLYRNGKSWD